MSDLQKTEKLVDDTSADYEEGYYYCKTCDLELTNLKEHMKVVHDDDIDLEEEPDDFDDEDEDSVTDDDEKTNCILNKSNIFHCEECKIDIKDIKRHMLKFHNVEIIMESANIDLPVKQDFPTVNKKSKKKSDQMISEEPPDKNILYYCELCQNFFDKSLERGHRDFHKKLFKLPKQEIDTDESLHIEYNCNSPNSEIYLIDKVPNSLDDKHIGNQSIKNENYKDQCTQCNLYEELIAIEANRSYEIIPNDDLSKDEPSFSYNIEIAENQKSCNICGCKTFTSRIEYYDHLNIHSNKQPYICSCGISSGQYLDFRKHLLKCECCIEKCSIPLYAIENMQKFLLEKPKHLILNNANVGSRQKFRSDKFKNVISRTKSNFNKCLICNDKLNSLVEIISHYNIQHSYSPLPSSRKLKIVNRPVDLSSDCKTKFSKNVNVINK